MSAAKEKVFDVRPLLAPGQGVTIIAPFMPAPLIELLKSEGFSATLEHRADGAWAVNFRRD